MRILQISPQFPYPPDNGGKIGIWNIYRKFAEFGADVDFLSITDEKPSPENIADFSRFGTPYFAEKNTRNTLARLALSVFRRRPLFMTRYYNKSVRNTIKDMLERKDYDIIHADHSSMAPLALFAAKLKGAPTGLRLHNIEWMIWQRYADNLRAGPKKSYVNRQAYLLKTAERDIYPQMDICFAITDKEKQRALDLAPEANVVVASAGVNPDEWTPDPAIKRNPSEIAIATTFNWVHNVDGLRWYIEEVQPLIRKKVPKAKLSVIGANPPRWLDDYKHIGVDRVGYVDRVQPWLNHAQLYIAPLFVGAGIRIKILEAMAIELPVVATPVSAEGIAADEKNGLFVTEDPVRFAEYIIGLCSNAELARKAGRSAREFVTGKYTWERQVGVMYDEYKKLTNKD
jgi:glycosyltransferase involved in cell wall biosynthesis